MSDLPLYITAKQIHEHYGFARATIHAWMAEQGFPQGILMGPNSVKWNREAIEEWIANRPKAPIHYHSQGATA